MSANKASRFRFRAWDVGRSEMIYNAQLKYGHEYWFTEGRDRLMQSTGLIDRNQKEIFESDICKFSSGVIPDIYEVFWNETKWLGKSYYGMIDLLLLKKQSNGLVYDYSCEIIGNIYENPELLNEFEYK